MRVPSVQGVGVVAITLASSMLGCTQSFFRPSIPRRTEAGGSRAEIQRADLRQTSIDVDIAGTGAAPVTVEGAWVESAAAPAAECTGPLAARRIEKLASTGPSTGYRIVFDDGLRDALEHPSRLSLRVAAEGSAAHCLSLPLSGSDPELRWTFEPYGENRPFIGRGLGVWFPIGGGRNRYSAGIEPIMLRAGRWLGPFRLGVQAGFGLTWHLQSDPNAMYEIPTALFAEAFPIVAGRFVVGVEASYALRPSWFTNDSSRGFELVHGPGGSIELGYLPSRPLGFLEGPRYGTIGLSFSASRWLSDGGATVLAISFGMN
jgi:hypothetical protein